VRVWVVFVPDVVEEVDLVAVQEERSSYAVHRRITPALVDRCQQRKTLGEGKKGSKPTS